MNQQKELIAARLDVVKLKTENDRLRAALSIFADPKNWEPSRCDDLQDKWINMDGDRWTDPAKLAREALDPK